MNKGKKVIVLVEPKWGGGHFETQMQLFMSIILKTDCRLIILCPAPDKMSAWAKFHLPEFSDHVFCMHFELTQSNGGASWPTRRKWQHLSEVVHKAEADAGWRVDLVFISFLDMFINQSLRTIDFKMQFDYPWFGLYFMPWFFRDKSTIRRRFSQWLNHHAFRRIGNCRGIGILDEGCYKSMGRFFKDREIITFPDVTDEQLPDPIPEKIRKIREEAGDRTILGLVGLLQRRKGLQTFLRSIQLLDPKKTYILVAGHLPLHDYSAEAQKEIKSSMAAMNGADHHFELDYIDDPREVNAYINLCDVLYLCYEKFYYSSGILTKAAIFKKPVIVSKGYCMGERVEKYRLGLTVQEKNIPRIVAALEILSDKESREKIVEDGRFQEYAAFHSIENLESVFKRVLELSTNERNQ